ncbi:MAG: hypothetical protein KC503_22650 [Myxococcales bacterium]|nr:hypothetical protein [Myxococcales bacterium]
MVLRCARADKARVRYVEGAAEITVQARAVSDTREGKKPGRARFVLKAYAANECSKCAGTLLIATADEFAYMDIAQTLEHVELTLPKGVVLSREPQINDRYEPDLRPPGAKALPSRH